MSAYNEGDAGSIPGLGGTLEKAMATHSSTLAWKIPWMEKSGGLQFMGLQRVGHDWVTEQQQQPRLCAVGPTARGDEHSSSSWS